MTGKLDAPERTAPFFLFAFLWSWFAWTPMVLTLRSRGIEDITQAPPWALLCALLGGYGPTIAALVMAARQREPGGVRRLLSRLTRWRAPGSVHLLVWFGPSIFLGLAILFAGEATARMGSPVWSRLNLVPLAFVAALPFGPMGEELGWRGFALPRLQDRYGPLVASALIGIAWTFWHTPLFWAPAGTTISGSPVTVWAVGKYLLTLIGLSILYTWAFNRSNGSALLAIVFHATGNAVFPFLLYPNREASAALFVEELAMIPVWVLAIAAIYSGLRPHRLTLGGDEPDER